LDFCNTDNTSHRRHIGGLNGGGNGGQAVRAVRDAGGDLLTHVAATLDALGDKLTGADDAAKHLARKYAEVIDTSNGHCQACDDPECRRASTSAWSMRWLGPLLLDCLAQLGATPAARAAITKKDKPAAGGQKSGLQALRDSWTA
jgi:hypothetical protein